MRQDGREAITRREWVSEGKEPGGLFSRSDTPQSRELKAQSMIATRNDHATGEGKQIPPPQPISATKKDIAPKTRDFLGFSSFFAVFLAFLKMAKQLKQKDIICQNRLIGGI
jgi:hypothetical protein